MSYISSARYEWWENLCSELSKRGHKAAIVMSGTAFCSITHNTIYQEIIKLPKCTIGITFENNGICEVQVRSDKDKAMWTSLATVTLEECLGAIVSRVTRSASNEELHYAPHSILKPAQGDDIDRAVRFAVINKFLAEIVDKNSWGWIVNNLQTDLGVSLYSQADPLEALCLLGNYIRFVVIDQTIDGAFTSCMKRDYPDRTRLLQFRDEYSAVRLSMYYWAVMENCLNLVQIPTKLAYRDMCGSLLISDIDKLSNLIRIDCTTLHKAQLIRQSNRSRDLDLANNILAYFPEPLLKLNNSERVITALRVGCATMGIEICDTAEECADKIRSSVPSHMLKSDCESITAALQWLLDTLRTN